MAAATIVNTRDMGLAEEAAHAAAERRRRDAAAPPVHSRDEAVALARVHAAAVHKAFEEAADVLAEQRVPAAVGVTTKRSTWGNPTPRFGGRYWTVAGHLLEANGQVTLSGRQAYVSKNLGLSHPDASWSRGFSRWKADTLFVQLENPVRVDFGRLGPASDDSAFIKNRGEPVWHVCPANSRLIILGRPEGPLFGTTSGGSREDNTTITTDLLAAIKHSVLSLVNTGGERG